MSYAGAPQHAAFASALQRRTEERSHPQWLAQARADADTRYLLAQGTTLAVRREPRVSIAFVDGAAPAVAGAEEARCVLLGWFQGRRCVLVDLPAALPCPVPGAQFEELRALLALLPEAQVELLVYARALLVWRARHRHCGVCGSPTAARSAGHVLVCTEAHCGEAFFPRIDPAIIVLVSDRDRALLGRQPSWPPGRYSTIAGFVEAGESLEQAVAREVEEETGVRVGSVQYFGSQPWPFPASLMVGFHAAAPAGGVRLGAELEDARWFDIAQLRAAGAAGADGSAGTPGAAGALLLPPAHTIARRLIESWVARAAAIPSPPQ